MREAIAYTECDSAA